MGLLPCYYISSKIFLSKFLTFPPIANQVFRMFGCFLVEKYFLRKYLSFVDNFFQNDNGELQYCTFPIIPSYQI